MAQEHRKEALMARDITPSDGVDYVLGMYVIGDAVENTQIESGVFLKGRSHRDLHLYEIVATEPDGEDIVISNLGDLKSRLLDKSLALYDGPQVLLRDADSNLAARYEPISQEARVELLRRIQS